MDWAFGKFNCPNNRRIYGLTLLRGVDFHELAKRVRLGHRLAAGAKALNVQFDCFPNKLNDFLAALASGDATGQIGNVRSPACCTLF